VTVDVVTAAYATPYDPRERPREAPLTPVAVRPTVAFEVRNRCAAVVVTAVIVSSLVVASGCAGSARRSTRGLIAFVALGEANDFIVFARPDGSGVRRIATGNVLSLAWSPNGRRLAFVEEDTERQGVYTVDREGIRRRRLAYAPFLDGAAWSPDGRKLAVWTGLGDFGLMNSNGRAQRLLRLPRNAHYIHGVRWAPNGRTIVVSSLPASAEPPERMYSLNADGSGGRLLAIGSHPSWSPNGKKIVYAGVNGLYTMNADGSGKHLFAHGPFAYPEWSPTGNKIAFLEYRAKPPSASLMLIDADGTDRRRIAGAPLLYPAWSPDGKQIAYTFVVKTMKGSLPYGSGLTIMNADGSARTTIVKGRTFNLDWGERFLRPPTWRTTGSASLPASSSAPRLATKAA
jgi:Tol biopolymer transport system component